MKYYIYTALSRVRTMKGDGSEGPRATQVYIGKGPMDERPIDETDGIIREVGTLEDIRRKIEAWGDERLIILFPEGTDTALVNLFPDKDTLVVLHESTGDFHAIQKAHVTVAVFLDNMVTFNDFGDLRDRDFLIVRESEVGSQVHHSLKKAFKTWERTDVLGWGHP